MLSILKCARVSCVSQLLLNIYEYSPICNVHAIGILSKEIQCVTINIYIFTLVKFQMLFEILKSTKYLNANMILFPSLIFSITYFV